MPPGAPVQLVGSNCIVTRALLLVTRRPLASWTSTVRVIVPLDPTGFGEVLLETPSLLGAPVSCVVSVAAVPAIDELFVVTIIWHAPGVVVDCTVKSTRPWTAFAVHDPRLLTVQRLELALLRVAVRTVRLSEVARFPPESRRSTLRIEKDVPSAAMGLVRNVAAVCVENPGRALVTIWLQPTRPFAAALT